MKSIVLTSPYTAKPKTVCYSQRSHISIKYLVLRQISSRSRRPWFSTYFRNSPRNVCNSMVGLSVGHAIYRRFPSLQRLTNDDPISHGWPQSLSELITKRQTKFTHLAQVALVSLGIVCGSRCFYLVGGFRSKLHYRSNRSPCKSRHPFTFSLSVEDKSVGARVLWPRYLPFQF